MIDKFSCVCPNSNNIFQEIIAKSTAITTAVLLIFRIANDTTQSIGIARATLY